MVKRVGIPKRSSLRLRARAAKPNVISRSPLQLDDMNDDCLAHTFSFLDINSLLDVCTMGNRIKCIIAKQVIPLKTVNFADVRSVREVFALFGESMTRIIVHSDHMQPSAADTQFNEFLCLLMLYGTPGRLQQVNLTFGGNKFGLPGHVLNGIGPYFANVHALHFNVTNGQMQCFNQFMNAIPKHNLRTLRLHNMHEIGDWMVAEPWPRLHDIHICVRWSLFSFLNVHQQIEEAAETRMINFIANNSSTLKNVDFDCSTQDRILVGMSQRMPNIQKLGTLMWTPSGNEVVRNEVYQGRWKHLKAFKRLKFIKLHSYVRDCSDLGEVFRILAAQNTIEQLALATGFSNADGGNPVSVGDFQRMTQLKTLNLAFFFHNNEFLSKLFANLPALTKCTLNEIYLGQKMTRDYISNVIQWAKKLTVLIIYCDVQSFTTIFYKKLLKIRTSINAENDTINPLTIYFSAISIRECIDILGEHYRPSIIALKTIDFQTNFCWFKTIYIFY